MVLSVSVSFGVETASVVEVVLGLEEIFLRCGQVYFIDDLFSFS